MRYGFVWMALVVISCGNPGNTVMELSSPTNEQSGEPSFFQIDRNKVGLSWLESKEDKVALKYAIYKNDSWTEPQTIASGSKLLANWADFPGVVVNDNHWLSWFLHISDTATFAYDVMITQSSNKGVSWSTPQKLHSDTTATEHGFVSAVPAEEGFKVVWLDGRNSGGEHGMGAMNLRSAFVDFNGDISDRELLDDKTCDCCGTALANLGEEGFAAIYRDRSEEEIRDLSVIKIINKGKSSPISVHNDNWKINGCPVNGPRSIVNGKELAVAWFTMGNDKISKVQLATSSDWGASFSSPVLIDTANVGRIDMLAWEGRYFISYIDEDRNGASVKIAEALDYKLINTFKIADVSPSRKTGFPRMASVSDGILVVYTGEKDNKIKLFKITL